ncbi:MAG: AbrB/MazE/SpoVT family DNA-binding domain-containing protein [archaeon]|nr:AbrB/MazE/SpoVT family DNA-binding domain-containing protein [archaeon]
MLRLKSKVGPKGQAVIPKEIRDMLGIKPGSEVIFEVKGDEVVVKPLKNWSSVAELAQSIPTTLKIREDKSLKQIILSEVLERWST